MSNYTTQVRFICETSAGLLESAGGSSVNQILIDAAPQIFNFEFPMFDENYRLPLEIKILRHYYTREISEETVGLWKLRLETRMNEIMPYYNQLYESVVEMAKRNPFTDVDLTTDHTRDNSSETDSAGNTAHTGKDSTERTPNIKTSHKGSDTDTTETSYRPGAQITTTVSGGVEVSSTDWTLYSDTPQGSIARIDRENNEYLTNATKVTHVETPNPLTRQTSVTGGDGISTDETVVGGLNTYNSYTEQTGTDTSETTYGSVQSTAGETKYKGTEEYLQHVFGKTPGSSYSKLLTEWRNTFLNIDMMIIEELSDLFFLLWE